MTIVVVVIVVIVFSLTVLMAIFRVSRYQNISILAFVEAKDDGGGGDSWSY